MIAAGKNWLIDGHLVVKAALSLKKTKIKALVTEGDRDDAIRALLHANTNHPRQLTAKDRRKAVAIALREVPHLSNCWIAKLCGVSPQDVANHRPPNLDPAAEVLGEDLKWYPLPVSPLRLSTKVTVLPEPVPALQPDDELSLHLYARHYDSEAVAPQYDHTEIRAQMHVLRKLIAAKLSADLKALTARHPTGPNPTTTRAIARRLAILQHAVTVVIPEDIIAGPTLMPRAG